ncbi:molybdate transport repressor ModE-like protein [Microbacterium testaceum]|uniref:LysR family transcriptional regulator n=1 Tax=Microbacterium TaxID=33882 RepID=UPI001AE17005|nr:MULTISPECIES: LysR family transcriptional regulator [Microbacterium]MDQ1111959.1 molybdate transport repressor ModE-like protein [Microbacterium testaceum]MDQ1176165.1 molybdate transport repressor ModE-like protein [Microbacterium sp. SORGH_AS_0421]MDR6097505.1 molybdate transport repressor ModE-like protein [Microbacterium sp. SORGH_AS_0454]
MLDVRRLSVLVTILDSGSLTAAAKTLGYSTSALSQQLQRLEQEVGQPLVRRQPRGVIATEAGALLAGHARYILRRLQAAESELGELAGLRRGRIAVGTFPTIGSTLMPIAISRFRRDYPQVRLDVQSARFDELVASLLENTIGLSLLWDYEWNRIDEPDLSVTPLFEDPTVLVVSQDHRLGRARQVSMSMLRHDEWIVRKRDHPVAEVLERSSRAAGFTPTIAFEANDYQEALAMVSVGLGVALAPRTAVQSARPDVRIVSLGQEAPSRRVVVAHRSDRVRPPGERAMHQILVEVAREHLTTG